MSTNKPARTTALMLLACGLAISIAAPAASAQSPARDGYDGTEVISTLPELGARDTGAVPPGRGVQRESGANGAAGGVLGVSDAGTAPAASRRESGDAAGSGSLPFTGFESGLVALMGIALVATGFALRRAGSARR